MLRRILLIIASTLLGCLAVRTAILQRFLPKKPLCKNCNVIVVTLDTLSANHLPCYGYARNTAPNLCSFAQNNVLFRKAYANATWTLPSHVSVFTGLYPDVHRVNLYNDSLSKSLPFLPEILQKQGYKTIFANDLASFSVPIATVYNRGIDTYINDSDGDTALWKPALSAFKTSVDHGNKTLLFLHTYDVHMPYFIGDAPKLYTTDTIPGIPLNYDQFTNTSGAYFDFLLKTLTDSINNHDNAPAVLLEKYHEIIPLIKTYGANPKLLATKLQPYQPYLTFPLFAYYLSNIDVRNPRYIAYIRALYDQRIHQMDEWRLTELFTFLNTKEVRDSTVVVITADHGEEFMEHGEIGHRTAYDSNLSIPLILSIPGLKKPVSIAAPVQSVDIVPTILELVGITTPYSFQGTSLVPLIQGRALDKRLLVADGYNLETKVMRSGSWKLFLKRQTDGTYVPYELYDTVKDPGEKTNIFLAHPDIVRGILREYQREAAKRKEQ